MKIAFFDTHHFEREVFEPRGREAAFEIQFIEAKLNSVTAELARGSDAVCCFVNDRLDHEVLTKLKSYGIRLIALRSAGFNHIDLKAAAELDLHVVRVPAYSPASVAEHAVALMLTLNRKIHRAYQRVRELNFSLEGLVGFDMAGKTAGVIGTGRIGRVTARILSGFGCRVLLYDLIPDPAFAQSICGGARYVGLDEIYRESDLISLHVPLTPETRHMIDSAAIERMKPTVLLINTGRGALVETKALIAALKHHRIGGAGLDVYEEEAEIFFSDHSNEGIDDDLMARLITFPNVIVTSHQAFLTQEALANIAATTVQSLGEFERGETLTCEIKSPPQD